MEKVNSRLYTIISIVLVLGIIGSVIWGFTQKKRADQLAVDLADTLAAVDEALSEKDTALTSLEEANAILNQDPPQIISDYKAAHDSGEYEQVRALFTDDGIVLLTPDIHWVFANDTLDHFNVRNRRVDEGEFFRLATFHGKLEQELVIRDWLIFGQNIVVFNWDWPNSISGTTLLNLRDGKIVLAVMSTTRDYISFQPLVNHIPYNPDK